VSGPRPDAIDAVIAATPYLVFLGLRCDPSGPTIVLGGEERHMGDHRRRTVHGGVMAAFLEAAGFVHLAASSDPPVPGIKAVDFTTDLLREAALVDTHARVVVVRRGRRIANVRVEAWQDEPDRPVAVGHGNYLLEPAPG
jgi:acyl-coenzyme A thioesterase PaaI-like protein